MTDTIQPPLFPITLADLPGDIRFHDIADSEFAIGEFDVMSRLVPHLGRTCGYRVTWNGHSVSYLSDHQQPLDGSMGIAPEVLELADGVDLLIHDAQYTVEEWQAKAHWGHCTIDYALHVAREAGVRRLALFHHDPSHSDADIDRLLDGARTRGASLGLTEVIAASEGLTLALGAVGAAAP
jgi:phosphoribosyl 1,2-cyclic phosphodiesterase